MEMKIYADFYRDNVTGKVETRDWFKKEMHLVVRFHENRFSFVENRCIGSL